MGNITLSDIRLSDCTLDSLPRLRRLRDQALSAKAEVCIERARAITSYLKDMADDQDPQIVRYAKAVRHFLSQKAPVFLDDNLLAGSTTSKRFGAPVYPELTGLTIWPELDTMSTREKNPQILSPEDGEALNLEIFPYWMQRSILEATRTRCGDSQAMDLMARIVFFIGSKAGTISHTVPCYRVALERGLEAIIQEAAVKEQACASENESSRSFYRAVQEALQGILEYGARLREAAISLAAQESDPDRKHQLETMAQVCAQVPAKPARSFREAVNALWILQVGIHAENINMAMSPGRLDQLLHPWYRKDVDSGLLSIPEALELTGCLWLKLNDNTNLVPETAEELFGGSGTVPAVTLGGVDADGQDAVNDLTYVMLRATELLKTRDPSVNARYHREVNSRDYALRVAEVVASTKAVPAFYNDIVAIQTLERQGISTEHARDYAIIGCVELSASGRSYDASSSIILNLVSVLELALYNGKRPVTGDDQIGPQSGDPSGFASFEDFWQAFQTQASWLIGQAVELNEQMGRTHQETLPTPLLSALFDGPMEKGKDLIFGGARYNSSGATHVGFADTVDSLNAIEQAVFIDKKCTFAELLAALRSDFQGHEALHAYLVYRTPKFGTENPVAEKNAKQLVDFLFHTYQARVNYRGGTYRPAFWTMTNHAGQGKLAGALPNGRHAYRVFASGFTPASQAASDLAACLNSVGGMDARQIPGGLAFNLKYPSMEGPEDLERFVGAIDAYFQKGGLHIQFNLLSYETLLDAKAHPENYPDLLVRVSGYSAYFKDLNDAMKDEIITRTAYDLRSGTAAPFPDAQKSMLPFA